MSSLAKVYPIVGDTLLAHLIQYECRDPKDVTYDRYFHILDQSGTSYGICVCHAQAQWTWLPFPDSQCVTCLFVDYIYVEPYVDDCAGYFIALDDC